MRSWGLRPSSFLPAEFTHKRVLFNACARDHMQAGRACVRTTHCGPMLDVCAYVLVFVCMCACMLTHARLHTHMHMHPRMRTHIHTCTHTHTHARTHTHTHTCSRAHTHTRHRSHMQAVVAHAQDFRPHSLHAVLLALVQLRGQMPVHTRRAGTGPERYNWLGTPGRAARRAGPSQARQNLPRAGSGRRHMPKIGGGAEAAASERAAGDYGLGWQRTRRAGNAWKGGGVQQGKGGLGRVGLHGQVLGQGVGGGGGDADAWDAALLDAYSVASLMLLAPPLLARRRGGAVQRAAAERSGVSRDGA